MTSRAAESESFLADGLRVVLWAALYVVALGIAMLPRFDEDVWWHLSTARWIAEHGRLPTTDPFAWPNAEAGRPLIAYSWLFEFIVLAFYNAFGPAGLLLLRTLVTVAVLASLQLMIVRREPHPLVAIGLTAASIIAILPLLKERPWLFTILFGIWTVEVVLELRQGRRAWWHWLLPLLYVVWANLHIQFVYGLFVLGLACVAPLFDALRQLAVPAPQPTALDPRAWRRLVVLTVLCTLATLVNPYHVGLYQVVVEYAMQKAAHVLITEMKAMPFRELSNWMLLGLFVAAIVALARRPAPRAFDVLLLLAGAWFAFRAYRDGWFLALASLAVLLGERPPRRLFTDAATGLRALAAAALVAGVGAFLWYNRVTPDQIETNLRATYPVEAVAYVKKHGLRGPLYNSYNWGGYLTWVLPEEPVSIDGRANVHGDPRLEASARTTVGAPGWSDDPELTTARLVIFEKASALVELLRRDDRFRLVHEDDVAVVFVASGGR